MKHRITFESNWHDASYTGSFDELWHGGYGVAHKQARVIEKKVRCKDTTCPCHYFGFGCTIADQLMHYRPVYEYSPNPGLLDDYAFLLIPD